MKKRYLVALMFLTAGTSAFAQEEKLDTLDGDADGRISIEEAASDPALSAVFADLDINKDGYLTAGELSSH